MPEFTYKALSETGAEVSGTLTADGRLAAMDMILGRGLHPTQIEERARAERRQKSAPSAGGRVSRASVEAFTRQLSNLLAAGVPLSRALNLLSREASQPAARARWAAIHDDVAEGMPLADALGRWSRSFPPVYVAMVRAGETGGFLELVLEQIADFRARERDLKGKVKAALVYPIILAVMITLVLTFLLTYFIPRFSTIFSEMGGSLPKLTRAIVAASNLVIHHGLLLLLGIGAVILIGHKLTSSSGGRRRLERAFLGAPALGRVIAHFALVRFCRMLGTLLAAGVPLVAALRVAREAIGNQTLADTVSHAVEAVQRGESLARSLAASSRLFPAAVVEMIAVAEESGRLDHELLRVAAAYEGELDRRLRMLVALAEPALLFVMAAIVGTVVVGMLLPIFTLQDLIR